MQEQPTVRRAMRLPDVLAALGLGRSQFYDGITSGLFPKPCKLDVSSRASIWWSDEIAAIQLHAIERRDGKAA
jgi:predicted DNA-binding transcriptional regulator AlpA